MTDLAVYANALLSAVAAAQAAQPTPDPAYQDAQDAQDVEQTLLDDDQNWTPLDDVPGYYEGRYPFLF